MTWRAALGMALIAAFTATGVWVSLTVGLHLWQDHQDHHLILDLLRYNIQQGRLVPLTAGTSSPPPPAVLTPAAPEKPGGGK
jgi:hypothetical protein